jgi:hypothetical protein
MSQHRHFNAAYKNAVLLKCYSALQAVGFIRFRKEGVDWPYENGFHCWVGLNTGLFKEYVQINPFVGLHVVQIEKFWISLKAGKYPGKYNHSHATYAIHMGELAPEEPVFRFTQSMDIDAQAARLAKFYSTVGLSYSRSIDSYEKLLPLLQGRVEMLGAFPERVACCLYLMGLKNEAKTFVEKFLVNNRDYFEDFAIPFLKKLSEESVQGRRLG